MLSIEKQADIYRQRQFWNGPIPAPRLYDSSLTIFQGER